MPPTTTKIKYYYAKLADNPLIFEIKGDKFADLLIEKKSDSLAKAEPTASAIELLRDPNPVRFDTDQVVDVTIQRPGQTLELKKTKGDPKANSESRAKRSLGPGFSVCRPRRGRQVSDLLDPLDRMSAKKGEVIDRPVLHALAAAWVRRTCLSPG